MAWVFYPLLQCFNCRMLPLKSWYPIDIKISPWYEIAFILQAFGQFYIGTGKFILKCKGKYFWIISTGYGICLGINLTMVYMLFGQIDMLNASLKNLGTVSSTGETKDYSNFRFLFFIFLFDSQIKSFQKKTRVFESRRGRDKSICSINRKIWQSP